MNETIAPGSSAYEAGVKTPEQAITFISRRMLQHRPRVDLTYRPYILQDSLVLTPISSKAEMDIDKLYPDAAFGDIVYIRANCEADRDCEAVLNVAGNAEIWFNGSRVFQRSDCDLPLASLRQSDYRVVNVLMKGGKNDLLIKCQKKPDCWGVLLYVAYPRYPFRWTRDYLLSVRPQLPFDEMDGMEGFAHIGPVHEADWTAGLDEKVLSGVVGYNDALCRDLKWQPRWDMTNTGSLIDFTAAYGDQQGCAYALSYVSTLAGKNYTLKLQSSSPVKVFIDSCEQEYANEICFPGDGTQKSILIKQPRISDDWWCRAEVSDGDEACVNTVPFIWNGKRKPVSWIITGPFRSSTGNLMGIPFPPEQELQFERPYPLGDYTSAFWRLPHKNAYIRPYRDGIFFGQWFYAVQVGLHGLMYAAKTTGDAGQLRYYLDSIQTMADFYEYMKWDKQEFGDPTLIPRAWGLPDLDACGTIGVSMAEAFELTGNPGLMHVIQEIGQAVSCAIPRFPDGTFNRVHTMWADDLYMSCPFLARLARLTGQRKYADEVYRQIKGFHDRLWIPEKKLFSHIFFVDDNTKSGIPWGRGNGWIAVTLTEVLSILPRDGCMWEHILGIYKDFMQGVKKHQDENGMWHQVLDRADAYRETSCTAMFVLSLVRGMLNGWLDEDEYAETAAKGWTALLKYSVDKMGDVYGVCLGSGCAREAKYYMELQTKKNDDHGTGIILMAAAEFIKLQGLRSDCRAVIA